MTHNSAMQDSMTPSNCDGELEKKDRFFAQDFEWTKATCRKCGQSMALLGGFRHRFNYLIFDGRKPYPQYSDGLRPQE